MILFAKIISQIIKFYSRIFSYAQTINKDLTFLSSVFKSAYKDELIIKNPVKLVDKLKETEKFTANYYTKKRVKNNFTKLKRLQQ